MCGIAAILESKPEPFDAGRAARLVDALRHRGPDSQGQWQQSLGSSQLLLVHTRLAILDLSLAGRQPMSDPDSGNVIIFNGEIYNYAALRDELKSLDPTRPFYSTSDTEVLLRGYVQWGTDVLKRLDGIFAFVLFDTRQRRLVVARDHLGIKPLYHARRPGCVAFASEVRALLATGIPDRDLDWSGIESYLRLGAFSEPSTPFSGVKMFPAGHFAVVPTEGPAPVEPRPYWEPPRESSIPADPAEHHSHLVRTVREQMVAEVPVGLFLSAGIDSTALATLASRQAGDLLQTFTIASGGGTEDESLLAAATARELGLPHRVFSLGEADANRWVLDGLDAMDVPSSDGINTYLVSRASRAQGMVVALAGTGADEIHGGYDHFYTLPRYRRWLRGRVAQTLAPAGLRLLNRPIEAERLRLMLAAAPNLPAMLDEKRRFFLPTWIEAAAPRATRASSATIHHGASEPKTEIALAELMGYLRNTLLRDSDWATMANGQELRVPFLGRRYLEHVLKLPWSAKARKNDVNKPLLAALIPPACQGIIRRPKTGFNLDYADMILGPLREPFCAAIAELKKREFRLDGTRLLADFHATRSPKEARRLWALLALGRYLGRHAA